MKAKHIHPQSNFYIEICVKYNFGFTKFCTEVQYSFVKAEKDYIMSPEKDRDEVLVP